MAISSMEQPATADPAPAAAATDQRRDPTVDIIRGIAVLQVLIWHLWTPYLAQTQPWLHRGLTLTWSGVDLFFVMSGYLIGGLLFKNREAPHYFRYFYARRVLRILPLYLLLLVIVLHIPGDKSWLWKYLVFVQNIAYSIGGRLTNIQDSILAPTWSLAVEEQFYLVLPLLIWATPKRALPWMLVLLVCFAPLFRFAITPVTHPFAPYMLLPSRMDGLFLGVLIAWFLHLPQGMYWARTHRKLLWIATLVLGCIFVYLIAISKSSGDYHNRTWGYTAIALFYGAVTLLAVTATQRPPRWLAPLAWMGLGTFSLYLFHMPIRTAYFKLVMPLLPVMPGYLHIVVITLAAFLVSYICWQLIERPAMDFGHRRFRYSKSSARTQDGLPQSARA